MTGVFILSSPADYLNALPLVLSPTAPAVESGQEPDPPPSDGFTLLDSADAGLALRNIEHLRNECSPFSRIADPAARKDGKLLVDSYYGRAFDFRIPPDAALYGSTNGLAEAYPNVAARANYGLLRVPYRIVPRICVRRGKEIQELFDECQEAVSRTSLVEMKLLWRGQTQEYMLPRSAEARRALYGDPAALEPSLLTSASRSGHRLEEVLAEWCLLIRQ
jgi:hypothetical protein